jgi:uncharacterized metal-binding protein YceD (DUF177 family)
MKIANIVNAHEVVLDLRISENILIIIPVAVITRPDQQVEDNIEKRYSKNESQHAEAAPFQEFEKFFHQNIIAFRPARDSL